MSRNFSAYRNFPGRPGFALRSRRLSALLFVAFVVLCGRPLRASAPATEPAPSAAILITFDPDSAEQLPVVTAVRAHLRGVPVRVLAQATATSRSVGEKLETAGDLATRHGTIGTLSVERTDDGAVLIFFTEPNGSATLIRRLPPNQQGVRATVEQVAIVVRSLVEALLDGARVGLVPPNSASPAPKTGIGATGTPPIPTERTSSTAEKRPGDAGIPGARNEPEPAAGKGHTHPSARRTVAMTTAYAGAQFATNAGWQSGLSLGLRWFALPLFYAGARYTFVPELEVGSERTTVSVARHPAEIVAGYVGATPIAANAELGLVADYSRRRTRSNEAGYTATPASSRSMLALGARAGVSWFATETLALSLRGGADFLLTRYSYVVPPGEPLASPHAIRPRLDLELAVRLW